MYDFDANFVAEPRAIPFKPEPVTLFVGVDGTPGILTDA